nr:hypothetical protein I308_06092 [Cryptococcus tetragattii IND107]
MNLAGRTSTKKEGECRNPGSSQIEGQVRRSG